MTLPTIVPRRLSTSPWAKPASVARSSAGKHRQLGENGGYRRFRRPGRAIVAFESDAKARVRHAAAEHAFRAGLDEGARHVRHQPGAEPLAAGHEERLGGDRGEDPLRRFRPLGGERRRLGKPGKTERQVVQGNGPCRHRAAVYAAGRVVEFIVADRRDYPGDLELHRMVAADIAPGLRADIFAQGQHARMLARAVVVDRRRLGARHAQVACGLGPGRPMGAAFQVALGQPRFLKHALRHQHMGRLAAMGGAGERDLARREAERIGRAGFDQRQRLERLDRRARIDRVLDMAGRRQHVARGIDHRKGAAVPAFDRGAAGDFDKDRVGHDHSRDDWTERERRSGAVRADGFGEPRIVMRLPV